MAIAVTAVPLAHADDTTRIGYLRRVSAITLLGLFVAGFTGLFSSGVIAMVPELQNRWAALAIILGAYFIANTGARPLVFSESTPAKWLGFFIGAGFEGIAMGYLLLAAIVSSVETSGSAFLLVGQALGLTGLTALGLTAYVWTGPRKLSYVVGAMSALALPMFVLMVISFIFPIGGPIGILISAAFVAVSAMGLLYQMNQVLHMLRSDMHVEGAYLVTMGVLVLFWNILTLLMRLNRR